MPDFAYAFDFREDINNPIHGEIQFESPLPYQDDKGKTGFSRKAMLGGKNIQNLELVFYDNPATASFINLVS